MVDVEGIRKAMNTRRPGGRYASKRKEEDAVLVLSGVEQGRTTGEVVELSILNQDAKSKDYSFLPDHPRPGHQDMVMHKRTNGQADLRGGGMSSARLTAPLVAAAAFVAPLLTSRGIEVEAHVGAIASVESKPMNTQPERWANEACKEMRCRDPEAAKRMVEVVEHHRMNLNSVGSRVDLTVQGLPLGLGEPWFDGIEPSLARGLMAIPGARAIEFSNGVESSQMRGSENNDMWIPGIESPQLEGAETGEADGALGGRSTGSPIRVLVHFKPPSSLPREQFTLHLPSNETNPLKVGGRHDPVIGPRAAPVVEAVAMLVIADLGLMGGFL